MAKKLRITLVKSTIGANPKNKKMVEALGFKNLYSTIVRPDDAAMRGVLAHISHMVKVEEIEE